MRPNVPSLAQIRASLPAEKNRSDSLWVQYVLRPLSFPVTWLGLKLGFSANHVSYFSIIVTLLATGLVLIGNRPYSILGALLFNLWAVLDCVDGNVARVRHQESSYGRLADAISGYVAFAFILLSMGIAAEGIEPRLFLFDLGRLNFIVLGALASIANLLSRLVYQKYTSLFPMSTALVSVQTARQVVEKNLGLTGFLTPLFLLSMLMGFLHWVVLFYSLFYTVMMLAVLFKMIRIIERQT